MFHYPKQDSKKKVTSAATWQANEILLSCMNVQMSAKPESTLGALVYIYNIVL